MEGIELSINVDSGPIITISSVMFDLPQILSESTTPVSGRKGLTRNVAARKPAPTSAWKIIVNGLDLSGPSRKTIRLASAVALAPSARSCTNLPIARRVKLEVKGRTSMTAPEMLMVRNRKNSLALPLLMYSLKIKLLPRLPTMKPKNPNVQTRLIVSISTPVFLAK